MFPTSLHTTTSSTSKYPLRHTAQSPESFDSLRRRNRAAEILQSYEQLSWLSFQRCETLTQTRLYIQRIIAEMEEETPKWAEDFIPHPKKSGEGSGKKGKERASLGGEGERDRSKGKERRSLGASEGKQRSDGDGERVEVAMSS